MSLIFKLVTIKELDTINAELLIEVKHQIFSLTLSDKVYFAIPISQTIQDFQMVPEISNQN